MTADIVVIGTGGMGREALAWLAASGRDAAGFLDHDPRTHGTDVSGLAVLGGHEWLAERAAAGEVVGVVVGIGDPEARERVADQVLAAGHELVTVVHPSAAVGPRVELGAGAIVGPQVVLTIDVAIGRCAILNYGGAVGHDGGIGEHAFIGPGVHLAGNVTVGPAAQIGIGASVIQGVTIGARAIVGAGAVVTSDVPPGVTAVGVPARPVR